MIETNRPQLTAADISEAIGSIRTRLQDMFNKFGEHSLVSSHECFGIIAEEMYELQKAVHENNREAIEKELADLGVCVILALASLQSNSLDWQGDYEGTHTYY